MNQHILLLALAVISALLLVLSVILLIQNRSFFKKGSQQKKNAMAMLFDFSTDGMFILDAEGKIQEWNPAMTLITGYSPREVIGHTIWDIQKLMYFPEENNDDDRQSLIEVLHQGELITRQSILEYKILRPDGEKKILQELVFPIRSSQGYFLGSIVRDITEWTSQDESLAEIALKDDLSNLYNRRGFLLLGDFKLRKSRANEQTMAILFIDLDGMKKINDTYGHQEGDAALKAVASLLSHCFREDDIIARIGGDEFAILATLQNQQQVNLMENRLMQYLENHNNNSDKEYKVEISMGHILSEPGNEQKLAELLKLADIKMYEQKKSKKEKSGN